MTESNTCPTCGSDCNERDELIKAEREIEGLQKSLNAAKLVIKSNDARQYHEGMQAEALRQRADDVAGERASNAALTDEIERLRGQNEFQAKIIAARVTDIAWQAEVIEKLRKGYERYETARRMNPRQWSDAWKISIETGKPFDEIIDDLKTFMAGI